MEDPREFRSPSSSVDSEPEQEHVVIVQDSWQERVIGVATNQRALLAIATQPWYRCTLMSVDCTGSEVKSCAEALEYLPETDRKTSKKIALFFDGRDHGEWRRHLLVSWSGERGMKLLRKECPSVSYTLVTVNKKCVDAAAMRVDADAAAGGADAAAEGERKRVVLVYGTVGDPAAPFAVVTTQTALKAVLAKMRERDAAGKLMPGFVLRELDTFYDDRREAMVLTWETDADVARRFLPLHASQLERVTLWFDGADLEYPRHYYVVSRSQKTGQGVMRRHLASGTASHTTLETNVVHEVSVRRD